jgi:hypothetical protein
MMSLPFATGYKLYFQKISNISERYLIPLKILMVYGIWRLFYSFTLVPGSGLNKWWGDAANKMGSVYASVVAEILNKAGVSLPRGYRYFPGELQFSRFSDGALSGTTCYDYIYVRGVIFQRPSGIKD